MTVDPVTLYPTSTSVIATGGVPVTLMYGPVLGGFIVNPAEAADQGLDEVEALYVDVFGPAEIAETATTVVLQPGQVFYVPTNQTTNVSVNAVSGGHRFSAVTFQPQSPVVPAELIGVVNPCLQEIIPSYLYQQYTNDDDLQAFVSAYNTIAQQYLSWLNTVSLPIYTGPLIVGSLLDWIALGLYGVRRPVLSAGNAEVVGPLNTYALNGIALNARHIIQPTVYTTVNDDIFKRILTWKLYKGDGKVINVRWLKRRILRFLLGADGTDVDTANTQQISVTFGGHPITITTLTDTTVSTSGGAFLNANLFNTTGFDISTPGTKVIQAIVTYTRDNQININLLSQIPSSLTGAFFGGLGGFLGDSILFNDFAAAFRTFSPLPNVTIFKQAMDQGVLNMPFQFKTVVNIQ